MTKRTIKPSLIAWVKNISEFIIKAGAECQLYYHFYDFHRRNSIGIQYYKISNFNI